MHHGVQAKLPGSDDVEYSLRARGYIVGRREVDILHRGQAIGHVSLLQFAYQLQDSIFKLNDQLHLKCSKSSLQI